MWPIYASPADIHDVFLRWLERGDTQAELTQWTQWLPNDGSDICLLDVLLLWIQKDRETSFIPSHSILLTGMMTTIDAWHEDDGYHIDGYEIVRHALTGELLKVEFLVPRVGDTDDRVRDHPFLNPFNFELARALNNERA
jgi:hypothetical protein